MAQRLPGLPPQNQLSPAGFPAGVQDDQDPLDAVLENYEFSFRPELRLKLKQE